MLKMTSGLATIMLAAGLTLGAAGTAVANTTMSGTSAMPGKTLMSKPVADLSIPQLTGLKGQELYDGQGMKIGQIENLVRGEKTHELYFVVKPTRYMETGQGNAAVPVDKLTWQGKQLAVIERPSPIPLWDDLSSLPLENFRYTGDTWSPAKA